jgi:hypothetical protein
MIKKSYHRSMFFVLTVITVNASAQTDESAVKQVINNLFNAMKNGDTARIRNVFYYSPLLQTVVKNQNGKTVILTEPLDSFLTAVGQPHQEVYDERINFDIIRIDEDLAMVWAPYKFYLGNRLHHCGVDVFQLVREPGQWKILYLVDTRRKNCE